MIPKRPEDWHNVIAWRIPMDAVKALGPEWHVVAAGFADRAHQHHVDLTIRQEGREMVITPTRAGMLP